MRPTSTVDFELKREPAHRVATRTLKGKWPGDRVLSREFEGLRAWTRAEGLKTGKWFFRALTGGDMSSSKSRWELGIEVRTRKPLQGGGGVSIKTFPATTVVGVKFDPQQVSPELVYCSFEGWMRWSGKARKLKANGFWREVYPGNPWKSKGAWSHTEIQVPLKK